MKSKALYSIFVIIIVALLFASCGINTIKYGSKSDKQLSSFAILTTPNYYGSGDNIDSGLQNNNSKALNLISKDQFYYNQPNGSFMLEENYSGIKYQYDVKYSGDAYIIKYSENDNLIKTIGFDPQDKNYYLINNKTNTSLNITYDDLNKNISDVFYPFDLLSSVHYDIKDGSSFTYVDKEYVGTEQCSVYEITNDNKQNHQLVYVSESDKIILKFEDLAIGRSSVIKDFSTDVDVKDILSELKNVPAVTKNESVPVEGSATKSPAGFFDSSN